MTPPPSALDQLAFAVGIIPSYIDQSGKEKRVTSAKTKVAILAAMGIDASTQESTAGALRELRAHARRELLAPTRVVEFDDASCHEVALNLRASGVAARWEAEVVAEDGSVHRADGVVAPGQRARLSLPGALSIGYHDVRVRMQRGRRELEAQQRLIIVPPTCTPPCELIDDDRVFGIVANLYSVHSERNWGIGDFTDLAALASFAGHAGGDFVGVNPLHALLNRGEAISPYSPVSRLFRNVVYIDVEAVPELRDAPRVAERIATPEFQAELEVLREGERVDYDRASYLKLAALEELYAVFRDRVLPSRSARAEAYDAWAAEQEPELTQFATWSAWTARGRTGAVSATQDEVAFHKWLQFEADRQLGVAAAKAREARLRIGLYQDLAIGASPDGFDTWAFDDLFVRGASIGAPPDPYSADGQNWGLPPVHPRRLRDQGYRYFIRMLRGGFRHSGALRIDHVMGLFRLFWIPNGMSGTEGAYVRMPAHDLLGILALESVRHRALVVGEDLGTVPKDVPPALAKWGVLSSKVLYFERDRAGRFRRPEEYPELSLATANTHDMPTLAGFFTGRDIGLRADVGLLPNATAVKEAREERERDQLNLRTRLTEDGLVDGDGDPAALTGAVHEYLSRSDAVLVGLSLDDLTGEQDAVNLPGVGPDRYPSWTRKMHTAVEELPDSEYVRSALRCGGRGARQAK